MKEKNTLLNLDFFRFTPSKFQENTVLGGIISALTLVFSVYLVLFQFNLFFNIETKSEILFENLHMQALRVELDVDLMDIPCDIVDLRFTAKRGSRHTVKRYKIDINSQNLGEWVPRTLNETMTAATLGEACKVKGEFHMHFLSNDIYLGFGNVMLMNQIMRTLNNTFSPSLNHRINSLRFGPSNRIEKYKKRYDLKGFDTLSNHTVIEERTDGYAGPYYHGYSITAVPNVFDRMFRRNLETFQYTASGYSKKLMNSAITFR